MTNSIKPIRNAFKSVTAYIIIETDKEIYITHRSRLLKHVMK